MVAFTRRYGRDRLPDLLLTATAGGVGRHAGSGLSRSSVPLVRAAG